MASRLELDLPDAERVFRRLLSDALSACLEKHDIQRIQLARDLSASSRQPVSLAMLNAFASQSNTTARFPAFLVPSLCAVLKDDRLQRYLMGPRLLSLVEYAERELAGFRDQREREVLRDELLKCSSTDAVRKNGSKP